MCYRTAPRRDTGIKKMIQGGGAALESAGRMKLGLTLMQWPFDAPGDIEAVTPHGDTEVGEIATSHAIGQQFVADIDSSMAQVALRRRWRSGDCCNHQPATTEIEVSG